MIKKQLHTNEPNNQTLSVRNLWQKMDIKTIDTKILPSRVLRNKKIFKQNVIDSIGHTYQYIYDIYIKTYLTQITIYT